MRALCPLLAAFVALGLASCSGGDGGDAGSAPLQVGLVFDIGGRGDKSFNDSAYRGLERAREAWRGELGASTGGRWIAQLRGAKGGT